MDFNQFYQNFVSSYRENNNGMRIGQFFMNELAKENLELYRAIPPDLDPFYNDKLLGVCSQWVSIRWDSY